MFVFWHVHMFLLRYFFCVYVVKRNLLTISSALAPFARLRFFVLSFELQFSRVLHATRWLSGCWVDGHLPPDSLRAKLAESILYIDVVLRT